MDLASINDRWIASGHPHALLYDSPEGGGLRAYCPPCGFTGPNHNTLMAAMNDALAHKVRCVKIDLEGLGRPDTDP